MNKFIQGYLDEGKHLTLLRKGEKRPATKDWPNRVFETAEINTYKGNFGWVLGDKDLVVDVDPRNGGDEAFFRLCNDLNVQLLPTVLTPRKGWHVYLKCENSVNLVKKINKYKGIDFLRKGSFVVIAGCDTTDGVYEYTGDGFTQDNAPIPLIELLSGSSVINKESSEKDGDTPETVNEPILYHNGALVNSFSGFSFKNNVPKHTIVESLNKLDPSMRHDDWLKVGMALHDWDENEGLHIWEEWSKKGENYEKGLTGYKWETFNHKAGGVTLGSLFYKAKEVGFQEGEKEIEDVIHVIKRMREQKQIWLDVPRMVKGLGLDEFNRDRVVTAIQERIKDITGVKPTKKFIAKKCFNIKLEEKEVLRPHWCKEWVYVLTHDAYVHIDSLRVYKQAAFNLQMGAKVPILESGGKQSASKFVSDNSYIDIVDETGYMPQVVENIVKRDGKRVLNTFKQRSMPECATEYTKDGLDAVKRIETHIKRIFKHEEHQEIFLQWLAHQVQYPGVKVFWAPIIQGLPGVGKSFFGELLRKVLGETNVNVIPPKIVIEKHNGWATGVCVNVLEELRISGHNRHEAVNELKPLITDSKISVREMYRAPYNTYNTTNYICFTNFKDSIPIDLTDRRWWVTFVDKSSEEVTLDDKDYFTNLFAGVRECFGEVRKWLMSVAITEKFKALKKAPMTTYKEVMVQTEESNIEGLYEVGELIGRGGRYYNKDAISSSDLFHDLALECIDLTLDNRRRNLILKHLGYMQIGVVKINGKPKRIWAKTQFNNDEIRKLLNV